MSTPTAEAIGFDLVFKALGAAGRRRMLDLLRDEPLSTSALILHFPELDRCTVMQHLAVLERANLVVSKKVGRHRMNHLNVGPLLQIQRRWLGSFQSSSLDLMSALDKELNTEVSTDGLPVNGEISLLTPDSLL